jgi:hypothetical protein
LRRLIEGRLLTSPLCPLPYQGGDISENKLVPRKDIEQFLLPDEL